MSDPNDDIHDDYVDNSGERLTADMDNDYDDFADDAYTDDEQENADDDARF